MLRRFGLALLAMTTGITGMMVMATAANAAPACGSTITTSTTLTTDLTCPATGLSVGASNVVLDLGGHTLTGMNPPDTFFGGVVVSSGRSNVAVRNGTIRGFNSGVIVRPAADGTRIMGLTLDANGLGLTTQTDTNTGTVARAALIVGNTILNTSRFSGIQLGGNDHRVEANTISNSANTGIFLFGNDNLIAGNTIVDSGAPGISISSIPNNAGPFLRNQLLNNRITGSGRLFNSSSISVRLSTDTVVRGNTITGRRATPGVFVDSSAATVVSSNRLDENNEGILVRNGASATSVAGNAAISNNYGIVVQSPTTGTRVENNNAFSNAFDGINISAAATVVGGNAASFNGRLGIRAVNGVTDGGGNHASGNGDPAQCTPNIACS